MRTLNKRPVREILHKCWKDMLLRCRDRNHFAYRNYGERGIKVCARWSEFETFFEDMVGAWQPGLTLDRINNNGNYSPQNCRWATYKEQEGNRRNQRWVEYGGRKLHISDWAREVGISKGTLQWRLNNGWPVEIALTKPSGFKWVKKKKWVNARLLKHEGKVLSVSAWARDLGIPPQCLFARLYRGWSAREALSTKSRRTS